MWKRTIFPRLFLLLALGLCSGCAVLGSSKSDSPEIHSVQGDIVLVADGAGDFRVASKNLRQAVEEVQAPLAIETFPWSHGYRRILLDQTDCLHGRRKGKAMAETVLAYRRAYPDKWIYLIGHSAGSRVALEAANDLPVGSVKRIILLNPSVPCDYDLRKALKTSIDGVDVHCSIQDSFHLGFLVRFVGICQGKWCLPAGLEGFKPVIKSPEDEILHTKLHHFPWHPGLADTGNDGGHYGAYQSGYLQQWIIPRMMRVAE